MNGATAEPSVRTKSVPNKSNTKMIGNNQNFLRSRRKAQSSKRSEATNQPPRAEERRSFDQNCRSIRRAGDTSSSRRSQYESASSLHFFSIGRLPNILNSVPVGVITAKKTRSIRPRELTCPSMAANLIQTVRNGPSQEGTKTPTATKTMPKPRSHQAPLPAQK